MVDRLKELIKYKGYQVKDNFYYIWINVANSKSKIGLNNQVPPAELEALLITHPDILDAAVIPYVFSYIHYVFH